ncbi:MAG: zinc ribbon domain-containing protein [Actinomycetota bacterium]|nr:zinc ribbon domain-containing protein [Actinomycetota bacterium]
MEYKKETRAVEGDWPMAYWQWKFESIALIAKTREAFKEKKLLGLKCPGCGLVYFPPKPYCYCLARPDKWVEVEQTGTITTYTFTGAWAYEGISEEEQAGGAPMIICGINFDGSDTLTVCLLDDAKPEEVYVGMRVKLKWPEVIEGRVDDIAHSEPLKE